MKQNILQNQSQIQSPDKQQINNNQVQSLDYQHFATVNRAKYPYCRAHNYFFALDRFPRASIDPEYNTENQAPGSRSYAIDKDNCFNSTYSHDQEEIKGDKIGAILNRKLFGCVINDGYRSESRDKNACHSYLFVNQDKSYLIDRQLLTLRKILRDFDKLAQKNKLQQFQIIRYNQNLALILKGQLTKQESKALIQRRITFLQQKKIQIQIPHRRDAQLFFHGSINQKLYNQIEFYEDCLSINFIFGELLNVERIRLNLIPNQQSKFMPEHLKKLFYYFGSTVMCISQQKLNQFSTIADKLFTVQTNHHVFLIDFPISFVSFANEELLELTQNLISYNLSSTNESSFYIFKSVWSKLTGRQIAKIKSNTEGQYHKNFKQMADALRQFLKNGQDIKEGSLIYPMLDQNVIYGQLQKKVSDYIFTRKNEKQLLNKQYCLLIQVAYLYKGLGEIYKFLKQNKKLIEIIGSPFYSKYQHCLVSIVNSAEFGLIHQILQRISSFIIRPEIQINIKLGLNFDNTKLIGYIYRKGQVDQWEEVEVSHSSSSSSSSNNEEQSGEENEESESSSPAGKPIKRIKRY